MKFSLLSLFISLTTCTIGQTKPFITTWKTDNTGISNDNQINIPVHSGTVYNYNVDWGDGTQSLNVTKDTTHTYASPGVYTVSISGDFPRIYFSGLRDERKLLTVEQWGDQVWTSFEWAFEDCENMNITATDMPDLSNVTNFYSAFVYCESLNADISNWDMSNVTDVTEMFYYCSEFNQDLTAWDISKMESLYGLFVGCSKFNQDLSGWDVSHVKEMSYLFSDCDSFNQDISGWNADSVTEFDWMFSGAKSFNQDISGWNVKANAIRGMFSGAENFNCDVSAWDVSNVRDFYRTFKNATNFNQDLGNWDLSSATSLREFFTGVDLFEAYYDSALIGWATDDSGTPGDGIDDVPSNIEFDGGLSTYCLASDDWEMLTGPLGPDGFNWTITDGGLNCLTLGFEETNNSIELAQNGNHFSILTNSFIESITVFDLNGKTVFSIENSTASFDLPNLNGGVYFVTVKTQLRPLKSFKIIKK